MNKYSLSIFWSNEDDAFIALSPEFPGLSAFGESKEDALKEAEYAVTEMQKLAEEHGEKVPVAREFPSHSGQFRVRIPRSLHSALVLEAERQGVSLNSLVQTYLTQGIVYSSAKDIIKKIQNDFMEIHKKYMDTLRKSIQYSQEIFVSDRTINLPISGFSWPPKENNKMYVN